MQDYKVYLLGSDGRVANRIDLVDIDEDAAKKRARELAVDCDVELWQGSRKITEYKAS